MGYSLYVGLQVTGRTVAGMLTQGWGTYFGLDAPAAGVFLVSCFSEGTCREPFYDVWLQTYPFWLPIIALISLVISTVLMVTVDGLFSGEEKAPGGARWASDKELQPLLKEGRGDYASPLRGYLGHTVSGKLLRVPENKRNSHTLIVGGPGSGKTTRYYKQNLLMDALDGTSVIILDLKYPDARGGFFNMIPFYRSQGYDVQLFLPFDEQTLRLPLLAGADTFEGASEFARMIVPIDTEAGDAEFYRNQERKLLTGLVWGMTSLGETSLGQLYRMLMMGKGAVRSFIESHPDKDIKEMFISFLEMDDGKLAGIINGLEGKLQIFRDKRLNASTDESKYPWENVNLASLGTGKSLLYIGLPQENLLSGDGQVLIQLAKRVIDRSLLRNARQNGGTLPVDTSFYLDEFPSLGELPNMEENFATMRSYRVGYHVALQNRAQLESVYGRAAANSLLTNLFQHILIFPRYLKFDDAKFFAEALGEMTVIETTRNRMNSMELMDDFRRGVTKKEAARALLSLEEMFDWPDAVGVVIANGMPPIRTLMPRLDETDVEGRNNQLKPYHKYLPDTLNVSEVTGDLLQQRRNHMMARSAAEGKLAELISKRSQPTRMAEVTQGKVVGEQDKDTFVAWIDAVLAAKPSITTFAEKETGRVTKIAIDAALLSTELAEPDTLKVWVKQRWLKRQREQLGVVQSGLELLGEKRIEQFVQVERSRQNPKAKERPQASSPNKLKADESTSNAARNKLQDNKSQVNAQAESPSLGASSRVKATAKTVATTKPKEAEPAAAKPAASKSRTAKKSKPKRKRVARPEPEKSPA